MNKQNKQTDSISSRPSAVGDLIRAIVVGGAVSAVLLLHGVFMDGADLSHLFFWVFTGGGVTFIVVLALQQLPTELFVYAILVLVLAIAFFIPTDNSEVDVDAAIQPEVTTVVQPEVTPIVTPDVVQPTN